MTAIAPPSIVSPALFEPVAAAPSHAATLRPYVSIVASVDGEPLARIQAFVDAVTEQCWRHSVPAELILVESHTHPNQPLADAIRGLEGSPCEIRVITAPGDTHQAGVRAAEAPYILVTRCAVLFSDGLMRFLAKRRLRPDRIYRADRTDIVLDAFTSTEVEQRLAWCERQSGRAGITGLLRTLLPGMRRHGRPSADVLIMHRDHGPDPRDAGVPEQRLRFPVYHVTATRGMEMNAWTP